MALNLLNSSNLEQLALKRLGSCQEMWIYVMVFTAFDVAVDRAVTEE